MEVRALGRSGIELSRIVLGCGNFGGIGSSPAFFGSGETEGEAHALMDAAWTAGITAFDTADAYGGGRSESFIGSWLRTKGTDVRERLVLTTKTFNPMAAGADHGLAPDRIRRQIEGSLSRLGVEAVDVYLAHEQDPDTPLEETIGALADLQRAGTIKTYGGSNVDRAWLDEALRHGRVECVQNSYSLLERSDETSALETCAREGIGYTPFGPLAGGWLTGKYRRGEPSPAGSRMTMRPESYAHLRNDRTFAALEAFAEHARGRGTTPAALALAWVLSHPHVTAVVIGPRRPEHLAPALEALETLELRLSPVERETIAELFS
jgi:aryl-alcohol dehydrogenase-like predicted oxidoreductase